VLACSDSQGYVYDPDGIDLPTLKAGQGGGDRGHVQAYAGYRGGAVLPPRGSIWDVPCDVALPCATQNELDRGRRRMLVAQRVSGGGRGRQHAHHSRGRRSALAAGGVLFGPGKAANAGGVATSALEMQQNASP
jgi:glutamate dehydrogenase (NADP+)